MMKPVKTLTELSDQDRAVALSFLDAAGFGADRYARASRSTGLPQGILKQLDRIDRGEEEDPDDIVARLVNSVESMPSPPEHMLDTHDKKIYFEPAPEMTAWILATFVSKDGPLTHKVHKHLVYAPPAVLWTNVPNSRGGNKIAGTASMPANAKGDPWAMAQRKRQLLDWFGKVPEFLITLHAPLWDLSDYRRRLAVTEHEMLHCGHRKDDFGCFRYSRETGKPIFFLKGHDVEVFVHEGERYGVGASSGASMQLFEAWKRAPSVTDAQISEVCGTCKG